MAVLCLDRLVLLQQHGAVGFAHRGLWQAAVEPRRVFGLFRHDGLVDAEEKGRSRVPHEAAEGVQSSPVGLVDILWIADDAQHKVGRDVARTANAARGTFGHELWNLKFVAYDYADGGEPLDEARGVLLVTTAVFQTDDVLGVALDDLGDGGLGESDSRYGRDVVQDDAKTGVGHTLDELTRGLHNAFVGGRVEIEGRNEHDAEHSKCSGVPSEVYSIGQSAGVGGHEQLAALNAGSHHVLQHLLALGDRERRALAARAKESDAVAADSKQVLHMSKYFREVDAAVCVGGNEACWPKPLQQPITHDEWRASAREISAPVCDGRSAMHATAKEQGR
jgi:hypothetical protein